MGSEMCIRDSPQLEMILNAQINKKGFMALLERDVGFPKLLERDAEYYKERL